MGKLKNPPTRSTPEQIEVNRNQKLNVIYIEPFRIKEYLS